MPGRFTSDTNSRRLLVSRSIWTTTMVDTCYPVVTLTGTASVLGVASFSSSGGTFAAAAPRATDGVILNQTVASGIDNVLTFDVVDLQDADEEGVLVTVLETIDNVPYVIGGGRLRQDKDQRINFRATGNNIQVVLNGPYTNLVLAQVCTRYARSTAQTYLVEVCDESKDRYRFGFNGQEKVNEIAGVGNHNTALFWEYDTRLGRRWDMDPKPNVSISSYATFGNNPIIYSDLKGDTLQVEYKGKVLTYGKDGEFYDGKQIYNQGKKDNGEYKGFLGAVSSAIGKISKVSEGEGVVDELINSKNVFLIKEAKSYGLDADNNSQFIPYSRRLASRNNPELSRLYPNMFSTTKNKTGIGGILEWDAYNEISGYNSEGNFHTPSFLVLAHEFAHASDANRGILFPKELLDGFPLYNPNYKGLGKVEWRAVYFENILRIKLQLPLRTNYGIDKGADRSFTPQEPYMLDNKGNPINYDAN